jgi:hypothetical protein
VNPPNLTDRVTQVLCDHEYTPLNSDAWLCACGLDFGNYAWLPDAHQAHLVAMLVETLADE